MVLPVGDAARDVLLRAALFSLPRLTNRASQQNRICLKKPTDIPEMRPHAAPGGRGERGDQGGGRKDDGGIITQDAEENLRKSFWHNAIRSTSFWNETRSCGFTVREPTVA